MALFFSSLLSTNIMFHALALILYIPDIPVSLRKIIAAVLVVANFTNLGVIERGVNHFDTCRLDR